ncbi:MAG: UbiA family prenyltransferase [Bdellovibrionia bacterium]
MKKEYWHALLSLGRVSNLPTILSNVTVGYYLGGGRIESAPLPWLFCIGAIVCFYEAGMFLNDICDFSVDSQERPERPLPSGQLTIFSASVIALFLFLLGIGIVAYFLPGALFLSLFLIGLIVIYNLVHTQFRLAPLLMGACRGSVYLIAATAAGWTGLDSYRSSTSGSVLIMSLGLTLYIAAVSFIARDELKASVGKVRKVQRVSAFVLLGVVLWPVVFAHQLDSVLLMGFLPVCFWFITTEIQLIRKEISPPKAVGCMLAGMSLWDGLVLATVQSVSGMCLAWACFGGARLWQRRIQSS